MHHYYSSAPDFKALIIQLINSIGQYRYIHQGHCGGSGHTPPNTLQAFIEDCLIECKSRKDVKFFSYVSAYAFMLPGGTCACYKTECLSDGKYKDHKAYEIVDDGMSGTNYL